MERKINIKSVYQIFLDYANLMEHKTLLDTSKKKKYLLLTKIFLREQNFITLDSFVSFIKRITYNNTIYLNTIHDLLPVLYYVYPHIKKFKKLAIEYSFDLSFLKNIHFDLSISFEKYSLYHTPSISDNSFIYFLENIILQHTNITDIYIHMMQNIYETNNFDQRLSCFIYPNKFWEKFDEYIDLLSANGDINKQLISHYYFVLPVFHVILCIYKNVEWFSLFKKYFFYIYVNNDNLFLDFDMVITSFKYFFSNIRLIFPLRNQFIKFLYYIKKLDHEIQLKFICKIFFLHMCPICNSYYSLEDFSCHFDRNVRSSKFKYISGPIPENYYNFHFIACNDCIRSWKEMVKNIYEPTELKFVCSECTRDKVFSFYYINNIKTFDLYIESELLQLHPPGNKFMKSILLNNCPTLYLSKYYLPKRMQELINFIDEKKERLLKLIFKLDKVYLADPRTQKIYHGIINLFQKYIKYFDSYQQNYNINTKDIYMINIDISPVYSHYNEYLVPQGFNEMKKSDKNKVTKKRIQFLEHKLKTIEDTQYDTEQRMKMKNKIRKAILEEKNKLSEMNPPVSFFRRLLPSMSWFGIKKNTSLYNYDGLDLSRLSLKN